MEKGKGEKEKGEGVVTETNGCGTHVLCFLHLPFLSSPLIFPRSIVSPLNSWRFLHCVHPQRYQAENLSRWADHTFRVVCIAAMFSYQMCLAALC